MCECVLGRKQFLLNTLLLSTAMLGLPMQYMYKHTHTHTHTHTHKHAESNSHTWLSLADVGCNYGTPWPLSLSLCLSPSLPCRPLPPLICFMSPAHIHTFTHTFMHTFMHTFTHTFTHTLFLFSNQIHLFFSVCASLPVCV